MSAAPTIVPAILIAFPIASTTAGRVVSRVYRWTPETETVEYGVDVLPAVDFVPGDEDKEGYFVQGILDLEGILDEAEDLDLVGFAQAVQAHALEEGLFRDE